LAVLIEVYFGRLAKESLLGCTEKTPKERFLSNHHSDDVEQVFDMRYEEHRRNKKAIVKRRQNQLIRIDTEWRLQEGYTNAAVVFENPFALASRDGSKNADVANRGTPNGQRALAPASS
jgi:hypothetical protein